jgi:hypothetical protein
MPEKGRQLPISVTILGLAIISVTSVPATFCKTGTVAKLSIPQHDRICGGQALLWVCQVNQMPFPVEHRRLLPVLITSSGDVDPRGITLSSRDELSPTYLAICCNRIHDGNR